MSSKGQIVAYIRVSTIDQDTARQHELAERADEVYEEKESGEDIAGRPELQKALKYLRAGDTLIVWAVDRLTRSFVDLDRIIRELRGRGVSIEFVSEGMKFPAGQEIDPWTEAQLFMLGVFAQLERRIKSVASREGIAIAKKEKRYKGRKPALTNAEVLKLRDRVEAGVPKAKVAREMDISRMTLYRVLEGDYRTDEDWREAVKNEAQRKKDRSALRREALKR